MTHLSTPSTPRRLLITGGAGFIGANFVHFWRQQFPQDRLIVLDALTYAGNLANLAGLSTHPVHYRFVQGDIGDGARVNQLLKEEQITGVINFAAESHVDRSIMDPGVFVRTNVMGTHRLLETFYQYWCACERPADWRFLHISTDEVYGSLESDDPPFSEITPYAPNSPYAASKASSDHFARAYFHTYGLPVLVTNCSNNYGPYQYPEKLIPLMIINLLTGKPLPVYGDGHNIRDWLYVDDHCRAIATVFNQAQPGETYNIGGNNEVRNLDLVHNLCDLLDELQPALPVKPARSLITFVTDRLGHDRRYSIDTRKIKRDLDWEPQQTIEQGLRATVEWYLGHESWWRALLAEA